MSDIVRIRSAWTLVAFVLWACLAARAGFAQSMPSSYTTCYLHNLGGQLTGVIRPNAGSSYGYPATRYTYNSAGLVATIERGSLSLWQCEDATSASDIPASWSGFTAFQTEAYGYDTMGRKTSDMLCSGGVPCSASAAYKLTEYSYDYVSREQCVAIRMNPSLGPSGNACALSVPQGIYGPDRITYTTYDAQDHPLTIQRAYLTSAQETYETDTYWPNGLVHTIKDANGNLTTLSYDGLDRLSETQFPSETNPGSSSTTDLEEYTSDDDNNRLTLLTRDSKTINYSYDGLDRLTLKQWPNGQDVYYGYDLQDHRLYANIGSAGGQGAMLDCGTASGQGVADCYDGFGNMSSETMNPAGVAATVSYQYDADDDRTQVTFPDESYITYTYDGLDRLYQVFEAGSLLLAQYSYDTQYRLQTIAFGSGVASTGFGYDGVSRLNSLSNTLATTSDDVSFSLDDSPDDQIASQTVSNSAYYPLTNSVSQSYTPNGLNEYSAVGGTSYSYDGRGNLQSDGSTTYNYDIENHLLSASGANLTYDALGRLYSVTSGSNVTTFVYDGDRIAMEYDGSGNVLRRFVYARSGDDPILWYEGSTVGQSTRRYLLADHEGSIITITDGSGVAIATNQYDTYGLGNSLNEGRFQYTGQAYIPEVGLYYYKARMYSPALGRFMQTDPIGYTDDLDLYTYVGNDPMDRTDTSGTSGCPTDPGDCEVHGTPQKTGTPGHDVASAKVGEEWKASGQYKSIHYNQKMSTIARDASAGAKQPDVGGVRHTGQIDTVEIGSKSQKIADLDVKGAEMQGKLPADVQGVHTSVTVEQALTEGVKPPAGTGSALGVAGVAVGLAGALIEAQKNPNMSGIEFMYRAAGIYDLGVAAGFLPPPGRQL